MGITAVFGGPTFGGDAAVAFNNAIDVGMSCDEAVKEAVAAGDAEEARRRTEFERFCRSEDRQGHTAAQTKRPGRWMLVKMFFGFA